MGRILGSTAIIMVIMLVLFFGLVFFWFGCRIEPGNGEIAIMIKKTGKNLPPEQIIATDAAYKGVQLEVLGEGRYFRNPYTWTWQITPITDIPAGCFGVLVRKFGKDLPEGEIIAPGPEYKGIVKDVLGTGKHRINPYAYEVKIYNDIRIMPGNVGVVSNLAGKDVFSGTPNDLNNHKGFIVDASRKGVLNETLKEGTHRINPFIQGISVVNIQSQRYEFSGEDSIIFLTVDGFNISLEGTVEFNIQREAAPWLTQEIGDMEDVVKKLILPSVSGFARIEGSKKSATEFIVGESRQIFQNQLEDFLRKICLNWGISINSVLIRDISPPQEIAEIIRNRELAQQEAKKFRQQIEQAKSAMDLERQKMLALQNRSKVEAQTQKITREIEAEQQQLERLIAARTELDVARVDFKTTEASTKALLKITEAERQVIDEQNKTEVEVLKRNVEAFGSGELYIRGLLYQKLGPRIESIMTNEGKNRVFGLPVGAASTAKEVVK